MALDGLLLHGISRHLKSLENNKISKINALSEEEILIQSHGRNGGGKLVINTHSNTNRLYLTNEARDFLQTPTNFVMVLRKHLGQGIITEISQAGFDRIIRFRILGHNELGDEIRYSLYAEMMGKYSNLILVSEVTGQIIDCLKRIPVFENSKRLLHPGAVYELPPAPQKQNPLLPVVINPDISLVKQVEGFSPVLSREYLYRMQNGQKFEEITKELLESETLYRYKKEFHMLPLTHLQETPKKFPLMEGLARLYQDNEQKIRIQEQCGDVFKTVDREIKRLSKKIPRLEESLADSMDYDRYREYGDLLFAWLPTLKKEKEIVLPSFETEEDIQIPIDMRYDLKDNAKLFYKKYHKLKRSQDYLTEQILHAQDELSYYEQLQEQLKHCSVDDALEIREELVKNRILMEKKNGIRRKKKGTPHVLHLVFDGWEVYAGKNNLQNQYVTHKIGRKDDLWFHVKDYHGSHVVLKSEEPDEEQIRFCASLAAYFSKGKDSSSVPIDYTKISQLKKVPGSQPGFVTMKSYRTIYIDPDSSEIEETIQKHQKRS